MSRLTGTDTKGLMEAYSAVYAPQELTEEQVWEEVETWVNSLLEEGYDLSEYTWEEMYEAYIEEKSAGEFYSTPGKPKSAADAQLGVRNQNIDARGGWGGQAYRAINRAFGAKEPSWDKADRDDRRREQTALNRAKNPNWKPETKDETKDAGNDNKPQPPAAPKPAAPKVAPTKPSAAAQTGDKAKDMATWAKANPKLAAAAAERARTRGTSATTNPQMDGLKSRLPAPAAPKVAPSNTLSNTVAAASKPAAFSPAPEVKATNTAAPKPAPVSPRQARLNMEMEYDAYDLVLEYLFSQGHAETVGEAHYIMTEMDAETIGTIVEAAAAQSDKQIDKGVKTTYKAQNVLDNQHQGRSKGLNKLPRGEREDKTKRMRGRLKNRRDDLFGERNKREDSRRDELKKMLGL